MRLFKCDREAIDYLCVRPACAGAGWNGKEAAIFDVVQWETRGLEFAWVLVLHPQDSILVEAGRGVCSVVHTSVSLIGGAGDVLEWG